MIEASGDPFGYLAAITPVFMLAIFLGTDRLVANNRLARVISGAYILLMTIGEMCAINGVVQGGSPLTLTLAQLAALLGAGGIAGLALGYVFAPLAAAPHSQRPARGDDGAGSNE